MLDKQTLNCGLSIAAAIGLDRVQTTKRWTLKRYSRHLMFKSVYLDVLRRLSMAEAASIVTELGVIFDAIAEGDREEDE